MRYRIVKHPYHWVAERHQWIIFPFILGWVAIYMTATCKSAEHCEELLKIHLANPYPRIEKELTL